MEILLAIIIGALFAGGIFCLLRRSLTRLVIGIMLLSQGANLLVFTSGGLTMGVPAFAGKNMETPPAGSADALPQALVLTAIVIGFGLVVFSLSLLLKAYAAVGSDDIHDFENTDRLP